MFVFIFANEKTKLEISSIFVSAIFTGSFKEKLLV